uniref:ATP-dependent Clp protease proteolytic subunit n=1 Tax=Paulinella chromatophora TaxID=39717 RepID=B1X3W0_PAUCH|nr:ATP-dependent Clp protease, proteolytic subunit ClpP [Paulinella chromatophora]ACB42629.1 ATP-dependent Clp protease, proteolytic subunit ClpP [Paulinella chromatophora]
MILLTAEDMTQNAQRLNFTARLMDERIIFLGEAVTAEVTNRIVTQLLLLEADDSEKDIYLYINSPGGSVYDGLGILDTMQHIKPDVYTVCVGLAASMGAFLLAAGTKGKRCSLFNSRIMIHQPSGGIRGQASDMRIQANEITYLKHRLNLELSNFTGKSLHQVEGDTDRDFFMSAYSAKAYGLIDKVVSRRPK